MRPYRSQFRALSSMYSHCNSIPHSYSTWRTHVHSVHLTRTSISHFITSATLYVLFSAVTSKTSFLLFSAHSSSFHIVTSTTLYLLFSAVTSTTSFLLVSTHPTRTSSYPIFLTSKPRTCSHYIITRTTSMLDSFHFTTATDPNYHLQQTFITNQVLLTVLKNQTTIMNTLNNLPMLLTRGPTTLPTTQMGMGFNSTLGVGDGVGATVGDNLMFATGVGNSSSIAGCV